MRKIYLLILFILSEFTVNAQVLIDSTDMPVPGEVVLRLTGQDVNGADYTLSGQNYIWDFSMLASTSVWADTFVSVYSTPLVYNIVFSNPFDEEHRATVASPQQMPSPPTIQISNVYNFYKNSFTGFSMAGMGASINGATIPVKFDHNDQWYHFPLMPGTMDTSDSEFGVNVPNLGYYGQRRHRENHIDGWGILYLPGDTLPVVRVKSVVNYFDTVYVDSLSFGMGFTRTENEYKWLAKGFHQPVLQVTQRSGGMGGNGISVWYHQPGLASGKKDDEAVDDNVYLYPNPASGELKLQVAVSGNYSVTLINSSGITVAETRMTGDRTTLNISNLFPGLYLLNITRDDGSSSTLKKFIKK